MAKDDTTGGAIRLVDYWTRKAWGGEPPTPEEWDNIDAGKITRVWEEICREACSGLIVIKAFRTVERINKYRIGYETEHAKLRDPIQAEFFQENVSFGPYPPYPIYYPGKGILDAPWLDPVVFVRRLATPPSTPGRQPLPKLQARILQIAGELWRGNHVPVRVKERDSAIIKAFKDKNEQHPDPKTIQRAFRSQDKTVQ